MSIVLYWLGHDGQPACAQFTDHQLSDAIALMNLRRQAGHRHVSLSTELAGMVGKPGVDAVEGGQLPGGAAYEWSKKHRGQGPGPG